PIERLVRVRIGPVRIDGLKSGRVRALKAPEVRGLGGGGGRSRGDNRAEEEPDIVTTPTAPVARPARPARPVRTAAPPASGPRIRSRRDGRAP
ncbi:MAG TPA: hypothetical protein VHM48_07805, partial [Candidatus Limnocylindrales bacterium]|nr:hypothetical protein [Candidatus Limnocylindrales bacterium]